MSTRPRRPAAHDGLFIVVLVGQAGSGKTTVARALEADGAVVLSADDIGHEVTDHDGVVRAALETEYGADVYGPDGLDRGRVAAAVFRDPAARERLNRLVHPRIVAGIRERLEQLRARHFNGVVVVDAALALDWDFERECDVVVAIMAPRAEQLDRLMRQRGWDHGETERRLAVQRSPQALAEAADAVIDNRGRREELDSVARETVRRLRTTSHYGKG